MELPQWLDNFIFNELGAKYCPSYANMTNIDDNKEKTLNYLGTYFPRSYVEAYSIFNEYLSQNNPKWENKEELSIFDFGSGTGGEIIGLLTILNERFPTLKKVRIIALDGNQNALHVYEKITARFAQQLHFSIEDSKIAPIQIDDFYDLSILDKVLNHRFDIIISFKAICEFVSKDQFELQNAYEYIVKFLLPRLNDEGLLLIEDITTYNNTSQEWLPTMMDKGLNTTACKIINQNKGYNQIYTITHSHKHNDVSKVAWRMIKR